MIIHGFNYIPNPKYEDLKLNQALALESVSRFKTSGVRLVSIQFSGESSANGADENICLDRDSLSITSDRRLPFIKDMFGSLSEIAKQKTDWIGMTNSDIVVTDKFYEYINQSNKEVLLFNRLEVDREGITLDSDLDKFLSYPVRRNPHQGRDGIFFRKGVWQEIELYLPDYILAEPFWDDGIINLLSKFDLEIVQDLIRHYYHPLRWRWETVGALYNKHLYDSQTSAGI